LSRSRSKRFRGEFFSFSNDIPSSTSLGAIQIIFVILGGGVRIEFLVPFKTLTLILLDVEVLFDSKIRF